MEDQQADPGEQREWDREVGINQRDRSDDNDCEPEDKGFPFFCDDDDDDERDHRDDNDCEPGDKGFPFCFDDDDDDEDVDNEIDQEAESGDIEQEIEINLSGDNSNQCVAVLQFGNTGNNQNAQGFSSFGSPFFDDEFDGDGFRNFFDFDGDDFEDFEAEGGFISFDPEFENECEQSVEQVAVAQRPGAAVTRAPGIRAAGPGGVARPGVAAGVRGAPISPSRAVPASLGKATTTGRLTGRLPRTGGVGTAWLLTLGIGALLVGGGLLARRLSR